MGHMQTPSDYLSKIGKRGGQSRSAAKLAAIGRNLKRAWAQQQKDKTDKALANIDPNRLQK